MSQSILSERSLLTEPEASRHDASRRPRPSTPDLPRNNRDTITLDSVFTASTAPEMSTPAPVLRSAVKQCTNSRSPERTLPRTVSFARSALSSVPSTPPEAAARPDVRQLPDNSRLLRSYDHLTLLERSVNINSASITTITKEMRTSRHHPLPRAPVHHEHPEVQVHHSFPPPAPAHDSNTQTKHTAPPPIPVPAPHEPPRAEVDALRAQLAASEAKLAAAEEQNLELQAEVIRLEDWQDRFFQELEEQDEDQDRSRDIRGTIPATPSLPENESEKEGYTSLLNVDDWWMRDGRKTADRR